MTLRESYTYQNFLDRMINKCEYLLSVPSFITTTVETHKIAEANPGAKDRVVTRDKNVDVDCAPAQVVDLLVKLLEEKEKISSAIATTKKSTEIDIDESMAMNKVRQDAINRFKSMSAYRSSESESYGTAYRLNTTSGSQERFQYVIESKTSIDFDRNNINALIKKYKRINDELSKKKDLIELTVEVEFSPKYDMDSSFEELI